MNRKAYRNYNSMDLIETEIKDLASFLSPSNFGVIPVGVSIFTTPRHILPFLSVFVIF